MFFRGDVQAIKNKPKRTWIFVTVLGSIALCGAVFLFVILTPRDSEIKNVTEDMLPAASLPKELTLEPHKLEHTFISPEMEADFEFNAIAPMWQGEGDPQHLEMRTADKHGNWTAWMEIETGPAMRDDKSDESRYFPETPLFIEGQHFQYRMKLTRASLEEASPKITDLKMNYIDSRQSLRQQITGVFKSFFGQAIAKNSPSVISRGEWGSPDPHGNMFKGTDKYWAPTYRQTKQVFLHHTVSSNAHSDPKAIIRGIWDYHANTLGWGDIGYNYLVDFKGNLYEGRHGGDHVTAGHTLDYNQGSMGVAVLGCFEPNSTCNQLNGGHTSGPTGATIDNLATLLSWKTSNFRINPDVTHTFCKYDGAGCLSIPTIAAHRQATSTECNGEFFYQKMNEIRQKVVEKNRQNLWGIDDVNFLQKASFSTTQQLLYGTDSKLYISSWGPGYNHIARQDLMVAPLGERFVDAYKMNEPGGTVQTVYAATQLAVYKITLTNGNVSAPVKLLNRANIKKVFADTREESETTHRLYVLANDGPYEYWWRDGGPVSNGSLLWNINNGLDFVKTRDPADKDEVYVATKSEVYRIKWPINNGLERQSVTRLANTTDVTKQNLPGGTELLYTATKTGVHETWWKSGTGFSEPTKIIQTGREVIDIEKTLTNNYQQLYVAQPGSVHEFWWGPGTNRIQGGRLVNIPQNTITAIEKSTTGSYQNLYTASQSFIYETWWGGGRIGTGTVVQTRN